MSENPKHSIIVRGQIYDAEYGFSGHNRMAIRYRTETGEVGCVLTVNLPGANLADGEFCIKDWSENERAAKAAMATGIFEDTGKRIPTGFVEAKVWKFKERSL
jgi:hypothetical protein